MTPLPPLRQQLIRLVREAVFNPPYFAREAGLSNSTLNRILRGERDPTTETLERIIQVVNADVVIRPFVTPTLTPDIFQSAGRRVTAEQLAHIRATTGVACPRVLR